jgi:plastocyanin
MGLAPLRRAFAAPLALTALLLALATWPVALAQDDDGSAVEQSIPALAVEIVATDFLYDPKAVTLPAGTVTFRLKNQGVIEHNLAVEDSRRTILGASPVAPAGGTVTLDVALLAGTYAMVCTLPAHREAGMVGVITVGA